MRNCCRVTFFRGASASRRFGEAVLKGGISCGDLPGDRFPSRANGSPTKPLVIKFVYMLSSYVRTLLFFLLSLEFVGVWASSGGEFYRWVDQNGVVHFTDNPRDIPLKQRNTLSRIRFQRSPRETEEPPSALRTKASVPIEKRGQVVVIEATINHKTAAKFVVDTGASYTMISSATARELAVDANPRQQTIPFQTANGVIRAPLTNLESITVGGIEVKNVTAAIHDVIPDTKVAGLLGLNFLSNFRMDIDTQKGLLHLEKR